VLARWENTTGLIGTGELKLPSQIYFEANLKTLETIDYPIGNVGWPVMSKRMLDTLRSIGDFGHRAIPVIILDDTVKDKLDAAGKPRAGVANYEFSAVQLTHYIDALTGSDRSTFAATCSGTTKCSQPRSSCSRTSRCRRCSGSPHCPGR
jgi:hypothetical protein